MAFVGWVETQLSRAVASSGLGLDPAYENQTEADAPPELKAFMGHTLTRACMPMNLSATTARPSPQVRL